VIVIVSKVIEPLEGYVTPDTDAKKYNVIGETETEFTIEIFD